jgi:serine/threonine protein kinase
MALELKTKFGQDIILENELASGGEGTIWQTNIPEMVAKIYYKPSAFQQEKLEGMIEAPPHDPTLKQGHVSIVWPQELLFNGDAACVGFLMPRLSGSLTLNNIYNPKLRKRKAPGFNWYYLHTAAYNIASILEALHQRYYVVGDIKPENFLVNEHALVSVTDTDSFQVKSHGKLFRCIVGSEGFTPPELIGKDFHRNDRLEVHDRFGLGVLIYMLLLGYHPFTGTWEAGEEPLTRDQAILKCSWPYRAKHHQTQLAPLMIPLKALDNNLKEAFLKTFNEGYQDPSKRLTAGEWKTLLKNVIQNLIACPQNINHFYVKGQGTCLWCERAQQIHVDIFPSMPGENRLSVQAAFAAALETKDYRSLYTLWQSHDFLSRDPHFTKLHSQINDIAKEFETLDAYKQKLMDNIRTKGDDLGLSLALPKLKYLNVFHEEIEGIPLQKIIQDFKIQREALSQLRQAITKADALFASKQATIKYERAVLDTAHSYHHLQNSQPLPEDVATRVNLAKRRVQAWFDLETAIANKGQTEVAKIWGQHFDILKGFQLPTDIARFIEVDSSHERIFKRFERFIKEHPYADDEIIRFWEREKTLQWSRFAQQSLFKNKTLQEIVNDAYKRENILKTIQLALPQRNYKVAIEVWDERICRNHPSFDPCLYFVEESLQKAKEWQKVKRGVLEGQIEDVIFYWDEALTPFAIEAELDGHIRNIFLEKGHVTVAPLEDGSVTYIKHRDFVEVDFLWPRLTLAHSQESFPAPYVLLMQGEGFVENYEQHQKGTFHKMAFAYGEAMDIRASVLLPALHNFGYLTIWAAQYIAGELLPVGEPWHISLQPFPFISYGIKPEKSFFGGRLKFHITLDVTQDFILPDLYIWRHETRVPIPEDLPHMLPFGHLQKQLLQKGKTTIVIESDKAHADKEGIYRLYPLDLSSLNSLTLVCREEMT